MMKKPPYNEKKSINKKINLGVFLLSIYRIMWITPKNARSYGYCKKCDYTSHNKYDFNRHLLTAKHGMDKKKRHQKTQDDDVEDFICVCGKKYKYQSGLCKHKHKCKLNTMNLVVENGEKNLKSSPTVKTNTNITLEMFNQFIEQQQQLVQTMADISKDRVTNYYNNCNNKKMTINVFLNEKCKDAMNLTDFVENVKVSIEDLLYTKEHGYAKGISNIFVKHLKDMDPTERPIHCSDRKRLQFYVKEENKWGKDRDNVKIDKSINNVTRKQIKQLVKWQKNHPDYENNDKLLEEYFKLTRQVMGGGDITEIKQNESDIKKSLGNELEIKDAMIIK